MNEAIRYCCFENNEGMLFWIRECSEAWERAYFVKWKRVPELDKKVEPE